MIRVRFYCAAGDGSLHAEFAGHAGAAPKGQDLICAGVSTLAETLGRTVERMYHQRMLRRCPRIELSDGRAEIIAVPKANCAAEVMMVFWTVQVGTGALAESFPENVALEETMVV